MKKGMENGAGNVTENIWKKDTEYGVKNAVKDTMEQWKNRKITSRGDAAELLLDMIRPLKKFYSPGHAWLKVGHTGVHYGDKPAWMEGFARVMWGLGPLWSRENEDLSAELREEAKEWLVLYLDGIIHGTDPSHEEYWGDLIDYDQKMVEMAALVTGISLSPQKLWEPLTKDQKKNLYNWLNQINDHKVHPNNWRFFRILVNMMFQLLELPWPEAVMEDDMAVIEACYTGDGWYYDGNAGQVDYYIPFAIHFYSLVYAKMMEEKDPERSRKFKERSSVFSGDFIYWFAADGREIPYGRSLTYRFAHSAFFGAMAFAGVEGAGYGVMKHLALNNIEQWLKKPIFDNAGVLTIGYGYPNLIMSERYNAPGSPYWAFKAFFLLAVPEQHPFWQAGEELYPYKEKKLLPHPHMLVTHGCHGHVLAYAAGQHCENHGACPEKYEKFVYSNKFGFSVSRGFGLAEGAFDNTLAVSLAGEERYQMRYGAEAFEVTEEEVKISYRLMPGVEVVSRIIPKGAWHVRIHEIRTELEIDLADGGFALPVESVKYDKSCVEEGWETACGSFPWGISKAVSLSGGKGKITDAFPNTNLFHPLTIIPAICYRLKPGQHRIVDCFMADDSEDAGNLAAKVPEIK